MAVMTRASFPSMIEYRGTVKTFFDQQYDDYTPEWNQVFELRTTDMAFEETPMIPGFGEAQLKPEGDAFVYDSTAEAWTARVTMSTYALGFSLTEEAIDDNKYGSLTRRFTPRLAKAHRQTEEVVSANILNRAFNANFKGGDGVSLINAAHPTVDGQGLSNILATPAQLSEAALEQLMIQGRKFKDDRGIPAVVGLEGVTIPPDLEFTAERILKSMLRSGTADNDVNAIKSLNRLSDIRVMTRLTSATAWFVNTDADDGLIFVRRKRPQTKTEGDFETGNVRTKATARFGVYWVDPRCILGTPGA